MYGPTQKPSPEGGELYKAYIDLYDADVANDKTADFKNPPLLPCESPVLSSKIFESLQEEGKLS